MKPVHGVVCVLVLMAAALPAAAKSLPMLSQSEQDEMSAAVLVHEKPDHPLYLSIRGHDPSPQFLARLGNPLYQPYSGFVNRKHGDWSMGLVVGSFILRTPDTAEGNLQQECGPMCGCRQTATLHRVQGRWIVQDVKTTMCS